MPSAATRRRVVAWIAVFVALAAALLAWRPWATDPATLSEPAAGGPSTGPTVGKPPPPVESEKPPLAARGSKPVSEAAARAQPPSSSAMGDVDVVPMIRVRGHVVGLDPIPKDTIIYVADLASGHERYIVRLPLASNGEFDIRTAAPSTSSPWTLAVGVWGDGFRRVETTVAADAEVPVTVELVVPSGGDTIEGRVLDENERPVAGVHVVWTIGGSAAWGVGDKPGPDVGDARSREDGLVEARSTSQADGQFVVRGLRLGLYCYPVVVDPSLWLRNSGQHVAVPAKDVVLRVGKGWRLQVNVSGAKDDDPTTWQSLKFWSAAPGGESGGVMMDGAPRPIVLRGALGSGGAAERDVRVFEEEHKPFEKRVRFDEHEPNQLLDVVLLRWTLREMGRVAIDGGLRGDDGRPVAIDVTAWTTFATNSSGRHVETEALPDGRSIVTLAPGEASIDVDPRVPFGEFLRWHGAVEVVGGSETRCPVSVPPHGSVRLRVGALSPPLPKEVELTLSAETLSLVGGPGNPRDALNATIAVVGGELRLPALPTGRFTAKVRIGEVAFSTTFTVRTNDETVADLAEIK